MPSTNVKLVAKSDQNIGYLNQTQSAASGTGSGTLEGYRQCGRHHRYGSGQFQQLSGVTGHLRGRYCFAQYPGFSGDPDCHRQQRSGDRFRQSSTEATVPRAQLRQKRLRPALPKRMHRQPIRRKPVRLRRMLPKRMHRQRTHRQRTHLSRIRQETWMTIYLRIQAK